MQKSERGPVAGSSGRTAGLKETGTNRSRVSGEHRRADRGVEGNRRAQVAAKSWKGAVGSQLRTRKSRSERDCEGKNGGLRRTKTTAERTKQKIK